MGTGEKTIDRATDWKVLTVAPASASARRHERNRVRTTERRLPTGAHSETGAEGFLVRRVARPAAAAI